MSPFSSAARGAEARRQAPTWLRRIDCARAPAPAPRIEEYRPEPAPSEPRKEEASLYLIAFKDHTIRAVLAYWAEGATLHYVTMDHEQKQTTVSSVDRELSERLNRERNVRFGLPR